MGVIPVFTSNYSISSGSILTLDPPDKAVLKNPDAELPDDRALSVFEIATRHKLDKIFLVDEDIAGMWSSYKAQKESGIQVCYGIKITVCSNLEDKSPESRNGESKVIIWFNCSQSYYDFVPLYTLASTTGMYEGTRRIDWNNLHRLWTENFSLSVPFYSSFLARNLTRLNHNALPDFRSLKPVFHLESHGLMQDELIKNAVLKFCKANKFETQNSHQVYYYRKADAKAYVVNLCIQNRSTLDKPELDVTSEEFSFEDYLNK